MLDKQQEVYEYFLSHLGALSPQQLEYMQMVIQSMLHDLDNEKEEQYA